MSKAIPSNPVLVAEATHGELLIKEAEGEQQANKPIADRLYDLFQQQKRMCVTGEELTNISNGWLAYASTNHAIAPQQSGVDLDIGFDETRQDEPWRNAVAKELNILLGRAQFFKETSDDESDREAEAATLSIVERVRVFEDIKTVAELGKIQPDKT